MTNGNEPAIPVIRTRQAIKDSTSGGNAYGDTYSTGGLTKREYFAAIDNTDAHTYFNNDINLACRELKIGLGEYDNNFSSWLRIEAALKVKKADALINELNKKP